MVAACTGHALAAGALLLLGCDVRVGADIDCKIGLNEVAIGLVLPDWALTIAAERLSRRHLQMAVATARVTDARGATEAGFLDEVVPADEAPRCVDRPRRQMSALDRRAYGRTVPALRGPTLDRMEQQIANDRRLLSSPGAVVGRSQQSAMPWSTARSCQSTLPPPVWRLCGVSVLHSGRQPPQRRFRVGGGGGVAGLSAETLSLK